MRKSLGASLVAAALFVLPYGLPWATRVSGIDDYLKPYLDELGAICFGLGVTVLVLYWGPKVYSGSRKLPRALLGWKWWGISWSFNRFIWITGAMDELRLAAFEASAVNLTRKTLKNLGGYVESHVTGTRIPLYVMVDGCPCPISEVQFFPGRTLAIRSPFRGDFGKTFGEPPLPPLSERQQWAGLTFVFTYDNKRFFKRFDRPVVEKEIQDRIDEIVAIKTNWREHERLSRNLDIRIH
jgi:hypothetical protein